MANVLVRYFTDVSFAFTEEISVVLMVVMTLVGAAHAFADQPPHRHHLLRRQQLPRLAALPPGVSRIAAVRLLMFGSARLVSARAWPGTTTASK